MLSSWTFMCQLNAIQWDIHVPIKCYPEGLSWVSGTFMCQLNAVLWPIHVLIKCFQREVHMPIYTVRGTYMCQFNGLQWDIHMPIKCYQVRCLMLAQSLCHFFIYEMGQYMLVLRICHFVCCNYGVTVRVIPNILASEIVGKKII